MISSDSNISGLSRKSGASYLNINSIISNSSKKMPGEKGLK
jgi:hypothetical protein